MDLTRAIYDIRWIGSPITETVIMQQGVSALTAGQRLPTNTRAVPVLSLTSRPITLIKHKKSSPASRKHGTNDVFAHLNTDT